VCVPGCNARCVDLMKAECFIVTICLDQKLLLESIFFLLVAVECMSFF
jgi:hypothetical protein